MKKLILIYLCLIGGLISQAQVIKVLDKENRTPIPGVSLSDSRFKTFTTTSASGTAEISGFKDLGLIKIQMLGYVAQDLTYEEMVAKNLVIYMDVTNMNLNEVVISASKWRNNSSTIPTKIISIPIEEVAFQNPQTAADLLKISGRVFVQKSQQGGGSPMIRGFATNRLLYSVDGVRMNNAIFRSGNIQNVINLDPFAIEQTEVFFGPGSVIYGSDAIGGVMSFKTLEPHLSDTDELLVNGKASTRYSSANQEQSGHFDLNLGWKKWAIVTSMSMWDFDDLRQGAHGPDDYLKPYYVQRQDSTDVVIQQDDPLIQSPSAYSQMNMMYKLKYKPSERLEFQYGYHYSQTSTYGRYDRHNRMRNGTARYAEWNYGPQSWSMHNLSMVLKSDGVLFDRLSFTGASQNFIESRIDRSLNKDARSIRGEDVDAYSANLDLSKSLSDRTSISYGLEYVFDDVTSTGVDEDIRTGISQRGPSRYPNSEWSSAGVYVSAEFDLSEKFTLQAATRYNQIIIDAVFDTTFYPFPFTESHTENGALTGSIGGVYRPTASWVLSANVGTAFRAPNVDDLGKIFDSEPGSVVVPNPDLKSEYAYVFDLNVAKVFNEVFKVDASAYYTLLEDALVRRDFQLNGLDSILFDGEMSQVQAVQNAAKANVYGIQAGVEIKLPQGFSLSTDLNYQKGEEELDDGTTSPSRHAAPLFGSSTLRFRKDKVELQFYVDYQGTRTFEELAEEEKAKDEIYAKDADGNNYSPSWYTVNLKSSYQISEAVTLYAGIENLTDQRYRPYSSGISAPGRNFILSLSARF